MILVLCPCTFMQLLAHFNFTIQTSLEGAPTIMSAAPFNKTEVQSLLNKAYDDAVARSRQGGSTGMYNEKGDCLNEMLSVSIIKV